MESARLAVRLKPRSKSERIVLYPAGTLDVAVTSPPVEGRANAHMIELLAESLRVPRSAVSVIKGGHCRSKVVLIDGISKAEAMLRLRRPLRK